jgi:hypothetical protein
MREEERKEEERELCQCVNAAIIIIWNLNNQTAPLYTVHHHHNKIRVRPYANVTAVACCCLCVCVRVSE